MIELVENINHLGWGNVIISFLLVVCVVIAVITGFKKVLSVFGLRSTRSIRDEEVDSKILGLQNQINDLKRKITKTEEDIIAKQQIYHEQSIEIRSELSEGQIGLKEDIGALKKLLEQFMTSQDETTVAMLRSSLWRFHRDFITQGFVTPDGLKTFVEMGKVYQNAGGNDIYHEKLLPEVEALEIHYPDGSIYNPATKSRS